VSGNTRRPLRRKSGGKEGKKRGEKTQRKWEGGRIGKMERGRVKGFSK